MDLKSIIDSTTAIVATGTFVFGAISAKRSWDEKRRELQRGLMERRQAEIRRLLDAFGVRAETFNTIFDYESALDAHFRITDLRVGPEEQETRSSVDLAFEHLRDLYRSLQLGLITTDDLSFWAYWIHRVSHRPPLAKYARACGYDSFLQPLKQASARDPQLRELKMHCPWWPRGDVDAIAPGPQK